MSGPTSFSLDAGHDNDLNYTIHDYQNPAHASRNSMSTLITQTDRLLRSAICGNLGWISPKHGVEKHSMKPTRCYMLAKVPPAVAFSPWEVNTTREWGFPVTEDEFYRTSDLDDFVGTNLKHLLATGSQSDNLDPLAFRKSRVDKRSDLSQPTFKKRRLNYESLHHVIPQPHMLPSPFLASTPSLQVLPFDSHDTMILPPYTQFPLLDDAHVAWLVPVRGTLPWNDCSSGTLLDDSEDLSSSLSSKTEITWTQLSLLKFWEYLVSLRKSGTLGALGISFHASENHQRVKTTLTNHRFRTFSTSVSTSYSESEIRRSRSMLTTMDYIKIYHDARIRLHLRRVIDDWSCDFPAANGKITKIMPLKNSRLVLLDDISQAILIL